jgi:SAM-dependent methyltransferase
VSGPRAGQRFDAEHGVTTEALIFLGDLDPEAVGAGLELATHYEATPVRDAQRLLDASPFAAETSTFVDVGSGMGRVVLLAARRPFKAVVGMEISPALDRIARENLAKYEDAERRCRDVRLVRTDATAARYPRGPLVLYLYNPFRAPALELMLARVLGSARPVAVLYHTPVERAVLDAHPAFELVRDLGFALVYRA